MQRAKRVTKFRTTWCPELLLVNHLLLDDALVQNLCKFPEELRTEEEQCTGQSTADAASRWHHPDGGDESIGDTLLGSGTIALVRERGSIRALLETLLADFQSIPSSWSQFFEAASADDMLWYSRLSLRGFELVHTSHYKLAKSRVSHYCQVRFEETLGANVELVHYIAKLTRALKLTDKANGNTLRIAVCDLYRSSRIESAGSVSFGVVPRAGPDVADYPVLLEMLENKVVFCNLTRTPPNLEKYRSCMWLFVPYANVQSYTDAV